MAVSTHSCNEAIFPDIHTIQQFIKKISSKLSININQIQIAKHVNWEIFQAFQNLFNKI